jgi:hypothetical protein
MLKWCVIIYRSYIVVQAYRHKESKSIEISVFFFLFAEIKVKLSLTAKVQSAASLPRKNNATSEPAKSPLNSSIHIQFFG